MAADTSKAVDGVEIYLGVLPAEVVLGHPLGHEERAMHGGVPARQNRYHVVVALFDADSGQRFSGARVEATVGELGAGGTRKALEPMAIANTETYGNWFTLSAPGIYRIRLAIDGIKGHDRLDTEMEFNRP